MGKNKRRVTFFMDKSHLFQGRVHLFFGYPKLRGVMKEKSMKKDLVQFLKLRLAECEVKKSNLPIAVTWFSLFCSIGHLFLGF